MNTIADRVQLTDEQQNAVDQLVKLDKQVQTLGGFAGTGKSTVISHLIEVLQGFSVCAYTGKAANVLRRKGISDAATIHSLIYKPVSRPGREVEFQLRSPEEVSFMGFIVDEASMVSKEIHRDLMSFDCPIVYIGDHGQLEPVGADDFNLMREPDVTLETIHRNAGEIAEFAQHLRCGGEALDWQSPESVGQVSVITHAQLADANISETNQIICAYNRTRTMLNTTMREHLQLPKGQPVVGDRLICLQNDREHGLFNGMQGVITEIDPAKKLLSFSDEDDRQYVDIKYNPEAFGADKTPKRAFGVVPFDWAYCVTCHKMQGSEAGSVLVLEERSSLWEHKRWAYTAASRAKEKLIWVAQ